MSDYSTSHQTVVLRPGRARLAAVALGVLLVLLVPGSLTVEVIESPLVTAGLGANPVAELSARLERCRPSLPEIERWRIAGAIHHAADQYGYDPYFILAMIEVESGCSPTARGPGGTLGLIQLSPSTAEALAREAGLPWRGPGALFGSVLNIQLGMQYIWQLEQRFRDPHLALTAYNMGPAKASRICRQRARNSRYVRRILERYESILAEPMGKAA